MVIAQAKVVLVSAIASGQGKTTTTAALARKLRGQGKIVRIFKTGPDFIDPMILERAAAPRSIHLICGWSANQHRRPCWRRQRWKRM
jgi:cobyrinic acid a,c-diamide synthase